MIKSYVKIKTGPWLGDAGPASVTTSPVTARVLTIQWSCAVVQIRQNTFRQTQLKTRPLKIYNSQLIYLKIYPFLHSATAHAVVGVSKFLSNVYLLTGDIQENNNFISYRLTCL